MDTARRRTVTKSLVQTTQQSTECVKLQVSEKQGILPEYQRLVFAVPAGPEPALQDLTSSDLFTAARAFQAIVQQDQRSIGRLVRPQVELQPVTEGCCAGSQRPALAQLKLVYDCWQPVGRSASLEATDVRICIGHGCSSSSLSLKLIGKYHGVSFVYPVTHSVSSKDLAAAVSLHLQQLEYIEIQRARHSLQKPQGAPADGPRIPRHHFSVQLGSEAQTCTLSINTAKEPHIQSITFNIGLLVVGSLNAADAAAAASAAATAASEHVTNQPAEQSFKASGREGGGSAGPPLGMAAAVLQVPDKQSSQQLASQHGKMHSDSQHTKKPGAVDPTGAPERIDANGHWCPAGESAAAGAEQQRQEQAALQQEQSIWKHARSSSADGLQQAHSNGVHLEAASQQASQPRPVPPSGMQAGSSSPPVSHWPGHESIKAAKAALPSTPPADDELSIRTARDTTLGGSSSSSSTDSSDGMVLINELAAGPANGSIKASPPCKQALLANGDLGSRHAQQNGWAKGAPVATFGHQELLAYQFAGSTADDVRSTLAQHDLLRDEPFLAPNPTTSHAASDSSSVAPSSPASPEQSQQQQQQQPVAEHASQPPSMKVNPEHGNSYAAKVAGGQQRSMPSYSSAVGGGSSSAAGVPMVQAKPAAAGSSTLAATAADPQRRMQRPYSQALASGLASSNSGGGGAPSSTPVSSKQPGQAQPPRLGTGPPAGAAAAAAAALATAAAGRSGRTEAPERGARRPGSPNSSSSSSEPWSSYQPGMPHDATPSHVPSASTDLERLLQQVTPMLHLPGSSAGLEELQLADVWKFYQEPSLYGREVYTLGGTRGPSWSYFVPYLSAVQLFVPSSPKDPGTNRLYISDMEGWPKHMHLLFEYFERELPFNRMPLHDMIEALTSRPASEGGAGPLLMQQQVSQLHPASWFSVAWYPVYRIPDAPLTARFLTFHSFAQVVVNLRAQKDQAPARPISLMPLQVIGLKWQNLQGERWLESLPEGAEAAGQGQGGARSKHATPGHSSGDEQSAVGRGRGRMQHSSSIMDMAWQAHLSELQATAERLSRGTALRILGQMGAEPADLRHPDFEFFHTRG